MLARGIVRVELALVVACLRRKDSDVLVADVGADLDPLEDKSCRWAEGKEKGPEDSRTPRVLGWPVAPPGVMKPSHSRATLSP